MQGCGETAGNGALAERKHEKRHRVSAFGADPGHEVCNRALSGWSDFGRLDECYPDHGKAADFLVLSGWSGWSG